MKELISEVSDNEKVGMLLLLLGALQMALELHSVAFETFRKILMYKLPKFFVKTDILFLAARSYELGSFDNDNLSSEDLGERIPSIHLRVIRFNLCI